MTSTRPDVALVPLSPDDAPRMYQWMLDPAVAKGIGLRRAPSIEATKSWIEKALVDSAIRAFAIRIGSEHVGNVVLDRIDQALQTARLSIYIGAADARGKRIGSTALALACRKGFEELGLNKIWLTVHARNSSALAAYVRCGFLVEGVLRDEFLLDGERIPAIYMGLVKRDYERRNAAPES
jgi:RimJ/RimL family protein N-acetyltransferase